MNFTTRKSLISILGAFLVCLIASTATTVVFAETPNVAEEEPYWGNLKAGDEMRWHMSEPSPMVLYPDQYYELEILELQGEILKVYHHYYGVTYDGRIGTWERGKTTLTSDELWPFIYPTSLIQENEDVIAKTYEYNGSTYTAAYLEWYDEYDSYDSHHEYWWDYSTGILFSHLKGPGPYGTPYGPHLESTNANLTIQEPEPAPYQFNPGGFASLETIVIDLVVIVALFSVVTVALISVARYQERKKKNT